MPTGETQDGLHIRNNLASLSSEGWIWRQVPQIAGPIEWPLVQNALPHPQKLIKVINFFYKAVELLLDSGADVEAKNNDGETALHIMARRRRLGCIIVLLSREANVNAQSSDGSTPLHQAATVSAACTAGIPRGRG